MIRESLAMPVFEAMGLPAPKVSFTRLTVNDDYMGVYNIIEDVEDPFLKDRLGESKGNLFKYEYADAYNFESRGDEAGIYVPSPFKPENHKDNPDPSDVLAFIEAINQLPDASFAQNISKYVDPRQFLTYIAVENALAESDGILGSAGMNNFYLYQYAGQTKFVFIVWDKNTSFQDPSWPLFRNVSLNVLARRLMADPTLNQLYVDTVRKAVTSYVNTDYLGPRLEAAYNLIRNSALEDTKKPYSNDDFELSVNGLRGIVAARRADVMSQVQ